MFKHLLVPTDGTEFSLAAVQRAVSFASDASARITFLNIEHVLPAMYLGEGAIMDESFPNMFHEQADSRAHEILNSVEKIARDAGVQFTSLILVSESVFEAIIFAAEKNECDLIFMASHGRRTIDRLLLGSVTEKVLSHTRIPVLVHR